MPGTLIFLGRAGLLADAAMAAAELAAMRAM